MKKRVFLKVIGAILCAAVMISMFACILVSAAVSFSGGSGTVSDPYIVTTPQQLDAMRNNLSAFYKLGATIDMASFGNFTQIGWLARPFKGGFTCDTDSNGTPLYAIVNLKVSNNMGDGHKRYESASYKNYAKDNAKWEAGLFGVTSGATLENILILDANIKNTVLGQHQQNPDFTYNPGQDEQGTAILVSNAIDTYITNCGVTGKINARTNGVGAIAARTSGSIIEHCYAEVNISAEGNWGIGALIGFLESTSVTGCFVSGSMNMTSPDFATGGTFVSTLGQDTEITNCYTTVNSKKGKAFCNNESNFGLIKNCYSTSKIDDPSTGSDFSPTVENSYYLSGKTSATGFQKASAGEIKAKLKSENFNSSGELPVIANMKVIKKVSELPAAGSQNNPTEQTGSTSGSTTSSAVQTSSQNLSSTISSSQSADVTSSSQNTSSQADMQSSVESEQQSTGTLEDLIKIVNGLPIAENITLENLPDIKAAKNIYNNLSDADFANLPAETLQKYNNSLQAIYLPLITDIANRTKALPDTDKLSEEKTAEVMAIYENYQFLPEESRANLSSKLTDKLEAAFAKVSKFADAQTENIVSTAERPLTVTEIIIIAVLVLLILAALGFHAFLALYIYRKKRKELMFDEQIEE